MSKLKAGEQSQTPRAIAQRQARADKRAAGSTPPTEPIEGGVSSEPIGIVAKPEEPKIDPEDQPEIPTYHCENCKGPILAGDTKCLNCELELAWPEGV